jgi:hypothetical protein
LVNLLLRELLDFPNSVRYLVGSDTRLLHWRRGRYVQMDKRCDADQNDEANVSHDVTEQLDLQD